MEYIKIIAISGSYGSAPATHGFNQESPATKKELFSRVYGLEQRGDEYFLHPLRTELVPDLTLGLSFANQHNIRFGNTLEFWRFDDKKPLRLLSGKENLERKLGGRPSPLIVEDEAAA